MRQRRKGKVEGRLEGQDGEMGVGVGGWGRGREKVGGVPKTVYALGVKGRILKKV